MSVFYAENNDTEDCCGPNQHVFVFLQVWNNDYPINLCVHWVSDLISRLIHEQVIKPVLWTLSFHLIRMIPSFTHHVSH